VLIKLKVTFSDPNTSFKVILVNCGAPFYRAKLC